MYNDYSDIIDISKLFENKAFNNYQAVMWWKRNNREKMLAYHKKYNKEHEVSKKIKGHCDICNVDTTNVSQHKKTMKHKKLAETLTTNI